MKKISIIIIIAIVTFFGIAHSSLAMSAHQLDKKSKKALAELYRKNPKAEALGKKAVAVLIFPEIIKAGFMIGGQRGDGALIRGGSVVGYYNTTAASYGFQAGIQKFGYALFFMNEKSLDYLNNSDGFELGAGPSIVVVDAGYASSFSTTTLQKDIYAFFFSQKGLMAGIGIQGTKITKFTPSW
ncbi:MAG: YSC84-related protein [Chthoniobacterales bacterium]